MKETRFVIEGTWSGYVGSQTHLVHRSVHSKAFKKLRAWAVSNNICFTDGTMLYLHVRPCKPRERVTEQRSYWSLIEDCAHYNVDSVDALNKLRKGE